MTSFSTNESHQQTRQEPINVDRPRAYTEAVV
jgi:hypothetical protein